MFRKTVKISLCLGLAIICSTLVLSASAYAAALTITGGRGGDVVDPAGNGYGGQGGYVLDDAFWASGGGGGGSGSVQDSLNGQTGGNGTAVSGGSGGAGGAGIGIGEGGEGGDGHNSSGQTVAGDLHSGESGGNGGGYVNHSYPGGSFTAEGGKGGAPMLGGGNGGAAGVNLAPFADYTAVTLTSGLNGTAVGYLGPKQPGQGGAASLTGDVMRAGNITLAQQDGALHFNLGTLEILNTATVINLINTTAARVHINTINLSDSGSLTMVGTGAGTFANLNVGHGTNTYDGTNGPVFINVNMAENSSLTANIPLHFSNMRIMGRNASLDGALNAAGKNLIFDLPPSLSPGQPMLNLDGAANLTGTSVVLNYQSVRPNVAPGESLTLIDATTDINGFTTAVVQTASGDVYLVNVSGKQLLAMLQSISPTTPAYARLKPYAESRVASLAFINQGSDLILNQGMGSAILATHGPGLQLGSFAAGSGGWNRYNTGSHVDVSGASMLAGLGAGYDLPLGRLTAGLFFEGGWGNYNSYNSFSNYASVDGNGDTSYYGGGILARWEVPLERGDVIYTDASARMGRASSDFSTDDIRYNGNSASFDASSPYWGAHAGLGYQWNLTENTMLDFSARFIWTRQDADNENVYGDQVYFNDADSLRTRLGGRLNYAVNDYITPYVGAYWEHEFDGRQHNTINSVSITAPSLKGDTGVGELGITIKPVKNSGFSMDLAVQGYTGVREGVTGNLQLKFEF